MLLHSNFVPLSRDMNLYNTFNMGFRSSLNALDSIPYFDVIKVCRVVNSTWDYRFLCHYMKLKGSYKHQGL